MSIWTTVAQVSAGINVVLLAILATIWGRNYLQLRSKHALGLLIFSVFLFAENGMSLYYYLVDPTLSAWFNSAVPAIAWRAMMLFHVLETIGLLFLTWITWD